MIMLNKFQIKMPKIDSLRVSHIVYLSVSMLSNLINCWFDMRITIRKSYHIPMNFVQRLWEAGNTTSE